MSDLLIFNNAKAKKKRMLSIAFQIVIFITWITFISLINFQNNFWIFVSSFINISDIPIFYTKFVYVFSNFFLGWLVSLIFIRIVFGNESNYINKSDISFKILLLIFFSSLIINSSSDSFLLIVHYIIYGFVCYKIWFAIEKRFYNFYPKMSPIYSIFHLKDTIRADKKRSEFILMNIENNQCFPWLYIDCKDNYIFTSDILNYLKKDGIPKSVISKINSLKNFKYNSREVFHTELIKKLDSQELFKYQSLILQETDLVNKYDFTSEIIDQKRKNSDSSLTINQIIELCFDKNGNSQLSYYADDSEINYMLYYNVPYEIYKSNK